MHYTLSKLPVDRLPLVNQFYKANGEKTKARKNEDVWCFQQPHIIAAVRLQHKYPPFIFMRSLCVASDHRGAGVASQLLTALNQRYPTTPIACFALNHLQALYEKHGYHLFTAQDANIGQLPKALQHDYLQAKSQGKSWVLMARY